jgi:hypothetical protein
MQGDARQAGRDVAPDLRSNRHRLRVAPEGEYRDGDAGECGPPGCAARVTVIAFHWSTSCDHGGNGYAHQTLRQMGSRHLCCGPTRSRE